MSRQSSETPHQGRFPVGEEDRHGYEKIDCDLAVSSLACLPLPKNARNKVQVRLKDQPLGFRDEPQYRKSPQPWPDGEYKIGTPRDLMIVSDVDEISRPCCGGCSFASCIWVLFAFVVGACVATCLVFYNFREDIIRFHPQMLVSDLAEARSDLNQDPVEFKALRAKNDALEELSRNLQAQLQKIKKEWAGSLRAHDELLDRRLKNLQDRHKSHEDVEADVHDLQQRFENNRALWKKRDQVLGNQMEEFKTTMRNSLESQNRILKNEIGEMRAKEASVIGRLAEGSDKRQGQKIIKIEKAVFQQALNKMTQAWVRSNATFRAEKQEMQKKVHTLAQRCGTKQVTPAQKAALRSAKMAFITMAHDPPGKSEHLWPVLTLARTLQRMSKFPLVVLTDARTMPDGVTDVQVGLERLNVKVMALRQMPMPSNFEQKKYPAWRVAYWKLQIWNLTQFQKLVWIDADTLVTRSIDWLFYEQWMWAQRDDWLCKMNQPVVCSGLMLVFPDRRDFEGLQTHVSTRVKWGHGDQELISAYFEEVRRKPIQLLSDSEAAFGQCVGKAPTVFVNSNGQTVPGEWNTPSVIHKSGGWGGKNDAFSNVCFSHVVPHQYYERAGITMNICHFNPFGPMWRTFFCEGAEVAGVRTPESVTYCDDGCWYRGQRSDPNMNWQDFPQVDNRLWCSPIASSPDGVVQQNMSIFPPGRPMGPNLIA